MRLVLLGPPGAGKGTQSKNLAKKVSLVHISTGDILRQNVANKTKLGLEAKDYMNKGELVPDMLVSRMLLDRIKQADVKRGYILDGYPRNLSQAETLDKELPVDEKINLVVYLETSESIIIQRLSGRRVCSKCGALFHIQNMPPKKDNTCDACDSPLYQRPDDKEATIKNRIQVYNKEARELIEYYSKQKKLHRINADLDAKVVLDKIVRLVEEYNDPAKV
ncbi:MAG: adenylate kinase [Candidatus Omnitrophota bacterium]